MDRLFNKSTNEFIDILARDTMRPRVDCIEVVSKILKMGNLNDAKRFYNQYGVSGLSSYLFAIMTPGARKEVL
jgi:hypothetical protein